MQDQLLEFIHASLLRNADGPPLHANDELLEPGMIDSLGVIQLLSFIEASFGIRIPPADVTFRNFRTVNTLACYLKSLPAA